MDILKEYGIKKDPRFHSIGKEAVAVMVYWVLYGVWAFAFGYLGTLTPPEEYTYIMGFPTWYFWAFLGTAILFPIIGVILSLKMKDISLEAHLTEEEAKNNGELKG